MWVFFGTKFFWRTTEMRGSIRTSHAVALGSILGVPKTYFRCCWDASMARFRVCGQRLDADWTHFVLRESKIKVTKISLASSVDSKTLLAVMKKCFSMINFGTSFSGTGMLKLPTKIKEHWLLVVTKTFNVPHSSGTLEIIQLALIRNCGVHILEGST